MANLATQQMGFGTAINYSGADAAGDTVAPSDRTYLHVKNGSAASVNVTVDSRRPCDQGVDHDLVVAVPAGGDRMIGPVSPGRFAGTSGLASVTYSAAASVTVAVIAL